MCTCTIAERTREKTRFSAVTLVDFSLLLSSKPFISDLTVTLQLKKLPIIMGQQKAHQMTQREASTKPPSQSSRRRHTWCRSVARHVDILHLVGAPTMLAFSRHDTHTCRCQQLHHHSMCSDPLSSSYFSIGLACFGSNQMGIER